MSAKICPQCGREYAVTEKFCTEDGVTLRSTTGEEGLVGQVIADRYFITKKLGEGGMGQVYLAEHVRMKRKCALKVMHPAMGQDPDAVSRFSREAANAAQIIHPNVAAVFDFGETPERLIYLAMEYVEGESLSALIERYKALPAPRAALIAAQVADALGAAHEFGIVHRDLKPDNIMIATSREGADLVKVVDFGIAKAVGAGDGQKVTRTGFVIGTPEYMSPEQLVGDPVDGRSDIYSLGLVAFNMFTGQLPFPSRTSQEAMIARLTQQPSTLAEMRGDLPWPPTLQAVMDRALARDPNERYANARDFGRDLSESMRGMPNLTAEQLGTQHMRAIQAAKSGGRHAAAAMPTMATAAPSRPSAPTGPRNVPMAAGRTVPMGAAAAPAKGGSTKMLAGAGVGVVILAGAAFALFGRGGEKTLAADTTGVAQVAMATDSVAAESPPAAGTATPAGAAAPDSASASPAVANDLPPSAPVPLSRPASQQAGSRTSTTRPQAPATTTPRTVVQSPASSPAVVQQPAYTAPAPAVSAPPAPVETARSAPAFDRAAAAADVEQALRSFVAAFETRRIDAVRRWYPAMSADQLQAWNGLLSERAVTELRSRVVSVAPAEFDDPTNAQANFTMALDFKASGQPQSQTLRYTAGLRKDGSNWRIHTLEVR